MRAGANGGTRPTALLVVGMHRSGTSAITRTLNLMGAVLPANLLEPSASENPTGFWESADIVDSHDRFLAAAGSRWDDPLPLPAAAFTTPAAGECHDELVAILRRDLSTASLFAIKDPRLCRLLPLWRSVLATFGARPMAVLPVRSPSAVAMSLHRRNGFLQEKSLALWLVHALLSEKATRGWPRAFVRYDDFVRSPAEAAGALASQLGCFSPATVEAVLPPIGQFWSHDLRHHPEADDSAAPEWVKKTYYWFDRAAAAEEPEAGELDAIGTALAATLEVYAPLMGSKPALETALRATDVDLSDLHQETARLERAVAEAGAECSRLAEANTALRAEIGNLTAECTSHAEANAALRAALDHARTENRRRREEQAALRKEADRNEKRLRAEQAVSAASKLEAEHLRVQLNAFRDMERVLNALRGEMEEERTLLRQVLSRRGILPRLPGPLRRLIEAILILPHLRGGMFDADQYRSRHDTRLPLRLHYALIGRLRGTTPNRLFDPTYYLANNPDIAASGADPFLHYARHGGIEGRKPSPTFDGAHYLAQNPDVARQRVNPLRHYLTHGWREGRDPNPFFDTSYYRDFYDIRSEPLSDYLENGAREGRRPSPLFDGVRYLADNPDVAERGINPLHHYLEFGMAEGRTLPEAGPFDIPVERDGPCILMVQHGLGGGVGRHCRDMEALLEAEGVKVWRLESLAEGTYRLASQAMAIERTYPIGIDENILLADLRRIRPDLVHVHHVIGFGMRLWRWLAELNIPYDVTIHDYTFFCPRVTLLDGNNRYCGEPGDIAVCDACVASAGAHPNLQCAFDAVGGVLGWRERSSSALAGARKVYVPDQDGADRMKCHFPHVTTTLRPHPEPPASIPARPPVGGDRVRIAIIGSIGPHKGFDVLLACARAARRDRLRLTFVVIGEVCAPDRLAGLDNVEVTGRYRDEDLPRRIEEVRCHTAAFLSVWPETYMYTLSAALRAGLYPIAFDLGAPARRIKELGWGEVLPFGLAPVEINRCLIRAMIDHPTPAPNHIAGHDYGCIVDGYYGQPWHPDDIG